MENQEFLTVEELAKYLSCSKKKVYTLVESHKIPFIRFVRGIRFYRSTIDRWLNSQKTNQIGEIK